MNEVEHVLSLGNLLGEGPLWHPVEAALYWVDIESRRIFRYDSRTSQLEMAQMDIAVGALAFRESGGLILATAKGFADWDMQDRQLAYIADPEADKPESRFNDGKVDRRGRFWAGTMTLEGATSALYRLDADASVHKMESGITIANGLGWSPDDKIMYFTDTMIHTIYAYDFDLESGGISNRRVFVHDPDAPGLPDGLCVDSEGGVWSARILDWRIVRFDPDGVIEREIRLPVKNPTSCAFGGENLDELYVTTAAIGLSDEEARQQPLAGDLFRIHTGIKGQAEPFYAG